MEEKKQEKVKTVWEMQLERWENNKKQNEDVIKDCNIQIITAKQMIEFCKKEIKKGG